MVKSVLTKNQEKILYSYLSSDESENQGLYIYPFRYDHFQLKTPDQYQLNEDILIEGYITSSIQILRFGRRTIVKFRLSLDDQEYQVTVYNQPYFNRKLEGEKVSILGKLVKPNQIVASKVNQQDIKTMEGLFPIYPLKGSVKQYQMRAIMKKLLAHYLKDIKNEIPQTFIDRYRLLDKSKAIAQIHFPTSIEALNQAQRTLKYEELLKYQVALELQRQAVQTINKPERNLHSKQLKPYLAKLPFELNSVQDQALKEIIEDLNGPHLMRRLLQGDVGSGKTVVALLSALLMMEAGYQICLLVPTEVLYHQHLDWFTKYFGDQYRIAGYTSSLPTAQKREVLATLESGEVKAIVATHAIFGPDVKFANLGYVIMDEQHRFGVNQRQALLEKGAYVDVLMMSATPIPRTLASSLYAHLEISTLSETVASREQIETILIQENSIRSFLKPLLERIKTKQEQVYMVLPAISEGSLPTKNVTSVAEGLQQAVGHLVRIASIHGQLSSEVIQSTLNDFKNGLIDILISTTIIEVGIDVANANTMIVYDADRFGLAQLHQLRGRIGRKTGKGYCYLLTNSTNEMALDRLQYLTREDDGFKIAEYDLKTRGAGDLLGVRQSGFPVFALASIVDDEKILRQAQKDAREICYNDNYQVFVELIKKMSDKILASAAI